MGEHVFDAEDGCARREGTVVHALELAERIVEEVGSRRRDWRAVSAIASELALLAERLAAAGERA